MSAALDNLSVITDGRSRRSSSWDRTGGNVDEKVTSQTLPGVVLRVGHDVLANNQTVYTIVLKSDSRVFSVSHNLNDLLPVVHEGDSVSITFDEPITPRSRLRTATDFSDTTMDDQMKAPAAKN